MPIEVTKHLNYMQEFSLMSVLKNKEVIFFFFSGLIKRKINTFFKNIKNFYVLKTIQHNAGRITTHPKVSDFGI